MMKRVGAWMLATLLLTACAGSEQRGVSLEVAGGGSPTLTPAPTHAPPADAVAELADLEGRLLILKGRRFHTLDLASGELAALGDLPAASPAFFNASRTHGVFSSFPNFGVLDATAGTSSLVQNRASNPTGFSISPNGQWVAVQTGQLQTRLQLLSTDNTAVHNVAVSSETDFDWTWTPDSKLVWWHNRDPRALLRFDPASGQSDDVTGEPLELVPPDALRPSPDASRAVSVPIATAPMGVQPEPCFDSYVELVDLPWTAAQPDPPGETVFAEAGLIASSPQWLTDDTLLFVRLGTGACGQIYGTAAREIVQLDLSQAPPRLARVAGPVGNGDDPSDFAQMARGVLSHLYAPSPDGRFVAWIGGGLEVGETTLTITDVRSGAAVTVLRFTAEDARDAADYIENTLLRQVVWLE